jgi:transposase InsO family protein
VDPKGLVLHSDNGSPMKGSTMLATLQRLGVVPSFSRPHVSDDNPFSEALFRTLKYCPQYPTGGFATIEAARTWVSEFVTWYNTVHLHSGIRFVTPDDRHFGRESAILATRKETYEAANGTCQRL